MDEHEIQELLKLLDDPEISEPVKAQIREGLEAVFSGKGFKEAHKKQLMYNARSSLSAFAEYVYEKPPYPHHQEIINVLEDKRISKVVIIVPPGYAKSTYSSVIYPDQYMCQNPGHAAILLSSSAEQSIKNSSVIRAVVTHNPRHKQVFPEIVPDLDMGWTRDTMYVANRGTGDAEDLGVDPNPNIMSVGMTSARVLGARANLVVIDDPVTEQEANSEREMEKKKEWLRKTLLTRLKPGAKVVCVLTRWSQKDLAAFLISELDFYCLHMPAIGDPEKGSWADHIIPIRDHHIDETGKETIRSRSDDEVLENLTRVKNEIIEAGNHAEVTKSMAAPDRLAVRKYFGLREDGDISLWPEEHSQSSLLQKKKDLGSVNFRIVYQGDPVGAEGDVFKSEYLKKRWGQDDSDIKDIPLDAAYYQSVDVAASDDEKADFFVITTFAVDSHGNFYIVDVLREHIEVTEQPDRIIENYRKFNGKVQWVLIEAVAYQYSLFRNVQVKGVPCLPYRPQRNKELRARSASVFFESGLVYIKQADWTQTFVDELTEFPRGRNDDQVDTVTAFFETFSMRNSGVEVTYEIGFG